MVNRFWTSDTHFSHTGIIKHCNRPFADSEEMNESLIQNWNAKVTNEDTVYHLGDFSLSVNPIYKVLPRLNRKKIILCVGNHDRPQLRLKDKWVQRYLEAGFDEIFLYFITTIGKRQVMLSHLPFAPTDPGYDVRFLQYRPVDGGMILIHGHSHSSPETKIKKNMIDVGVDAWDYSPVSEEELIPLVEGFYD